MSNKIIYLITTYKCSACKCMGYILKNVQEKSPTFTITTTDFHDCPEWLKDNITFTDFPTIIFVENDDVKYYFTGTMSESKVIQLMKDINF